MNEQKLIAWLREYQEKQRKLIFGCTLSPNAQQLVWGKIYALDDIIKAVGTTTAFDESVAHTNRGKLNGMSNEGLAEMLVSFFTNKDGNSRYTFCNLDCEYKDYDDAIIACMKWLANKSDQDRSDNE